MRSGLNGKRPKLERILSDPSARVVLVEHGDRLALFGVESLEAAVAAEDRRWWWPMQVRRPTIWCAT